jgi:hypothetical protein
MATDTQERWHRLPLPLAAPVIVNSHEARAFAAWRTRSIAAPTPPRSFLYLLHLPLQTHRIVGMFEAVDPWENVASEISGHATQDVYSS